MCATQAVRSLVKQRTPSELALLLPPYAYLFKRLSMDPNRSVRAEAAAALVAITAPLGKALAPHLKSLMGPWLMATFDAYGEAAATARAGLTVRPGRYDDGRRSGSTLQERQTLQERRTPVMMCLPQRSRLRTHCLSLCGFAQLPCYVLCQGFWC